MCRITPQNGTLCDGRPVTDVASGHGELELESADEGKQDCLCPASDFPVKNEGLGAVRKK